MERPELTGCPIQRVEEMGNGLVRFRHSREGTTLSLFAGNKIQRCGIHAVAQMSRRRTVVEHMSEVRVAPRAQNLIALHT
jgi:hypothetical protein